MGSLIERKKKIMMMLQQSGGGLPSAYQQIEWLGNSGTQYIATNYSPSVDNVDVTWEYMFTANQTRDGMIWGAQGSSTIQTWQCEFYDNRAWYVGVGTKLYRNVLANIGGTINTKYTGHANAESLTINGHNTSPTDTRNGPQTQYINIFAWRTTEGGVNFINKGCRIYSLEFKENGVVAANFVPCIRKSDSEPGMYDTVSNTFYTNAGTGTFIIPS